MTPHAFIPKWRAASALPGDTPPVPPLGEQLWALRPRLDGGVPAVNGFTPDARRAVDGWAGACAVTWRSGGRKRGGFWAAEASNYGHSPTHTCFRRLLKLHPVADVDRAVVGGNK